MLLQLYFVFSVLFLIVQNGNAQDFGYEGPNGPDHWGEQYKSCNGKYQSPIDIESKNVMTKSFPALVMDNFNKKLQKAKLENNGHTVQLSRTDEILPTVSGGPLNNKYNFQQLHFHWGKTDSVGSEHTFNGKRFPLELHMVFYNSKYGTFQGSLSHPDGLTVLGFLFRVVSSNNTNYKLFDEKMKQVISKGSSIEVNNLFAVGQFSEPKPAKYFTYKGSLTTPPCSEIVTWIVFSNTIPISSQQIAAFRELSSGNGKLNQNFRPIQPLNRRDIFSPTRSQ